MARQVQLRRGTTAEHENFIGAPGEITYDTDLKTLRVHDGETPGGVVLARIDTVPTIPTTAPASDMPNSILTTVAMSKNDSGSGYVKLGNGLIIQWGNIHPTASSVTVTYPIPFTTNNPIITHGFNTPGTEYGCTSVNAISFNLNSSATSTSRVFRWIAIGY